MTDYCAFSLLDHKLKLVRVCYPTPLSLSDSLLTFGEVCLCVRSITTFSFCRLFTAKCCITVDHSLGHSLALLLSLVLHLHDDLLGGVLGGHLLLAGVL